jgi:hypothetical protein
MRRLFGWKCLPGCERPRKHSAGARLCEHPPVWPGDWLRDGVCRPGPCDRLVEGITHSLSAMRWPHATGFVKRANRGATAYIRPGCNVLPLSLGASVLHLNLVQHQRLTRPGSGAGAAASSAGFRRLVLLQASMREKRVRADAQPRQSPPRRRCAPGRRGPESAARPRFGPATGCRRRSPAPRHGQRRSPRTRGRRAGQTGG